MMAQGGIQAADKPNDTPAIHYLDVMGGGGFKNIPELVRALTHDAPLCIKWLEELGAMLDKSPTGPWSPSTAAGRAGGACTRPGTTAGRRSCGRSGTNFAAGPFPFREFCSAVELLLDSRGQCAGAILYDMETEEYSVVRAKAVILATGGMGRLHVQGFPAPTITGPPATA